MNDRPASPGLGDFWAMVKALWKLVRGEDGRGRKLRGLLGLLRPYRSRVALMMVALLIATATALAPPYLAGLAVDKGITPGDSQALTLIVLAFLASAAINWGATYLQTYLVGWVGRGRCRISASASTRTCRRCRSASTPATGPAS